MLLSVKDEQMQEYEREVREQACGLVEFALCDAIESVCRALKRIKGRIASHHNELRVVQSIEEACRQLGPEFFERIVAEIDVDFEGAVATADSQDLINDHEMIVDEVRKYFRKLVETFTSCSSCEQ